MRKVFKFPKMETISKEYEKEIKSDEREMYIEDFRNSWMDWNNRIWTVISDSTSESLDEDMRLSFKDQTIENAWIMCAQDYLESIKKAVKDSMSDKEIFERMSKEELEEYKRVEKELKHQEVLNEL